jgi:cyclohexyl-isocyanide hydratase
MLDVTGPAEMFGWADIDVELVAAEPGLLSFRNGFRFEVTCSFDQARTYDALWVPGGDPQALSDIIADPDQTYLGFLRAQARTTDRWICSVCEGAMLLAAAGLLDGYRATTHWAFIPCFAERFPKVAVADGFPRFVEDGDDRGKRLTGGGISSGLDEALRLIALLKGPKAAAEAQQSTQYYPDPPVRSAIPHQLTCPLPPPKPRAA